MNIEELNLSVRAYNVLKRANINTVEQICEMSAWELSCLRNMGTKTLEEIRDKVLAAGFDAFGMIAPPPSNGDKLRRSSDEELADFLSRQQISIVKAIYEAFDEPIPDAMTGAKEEWLDWLKQEATDG